MTPEHDPDFERYSLQKLVVIEPSIGAMTVMLPLLPLLPPITSITAITNPSIPVQSEGNSGNRGNSPYYLYYPYYPADCEVMQWLVIAVIEVIGGNRG